MFVLAALTIFIIIHSNRRFGKKNETENGDAMFQAIISTDDKSQTWPMLLMYITEQQRSFMAYADEKYRTITSAFINDNDGALGKAESSLAKQKTILKMHAAKRPCACVISPGKWPSRKAHGSI